MLREIWKWIPGYEGSYRVSNKGRVLSVARFTSTPKASTGFRAVPRKFLTVRSRKFTDRGDYCVVSLREEGRRQARGWKVGALVLIAFVGPRPVNGFVCHKNDDPEDNTVENLYWGSHKSNTKDAIRNGRTLKGERNPASKLKNREVSKIKRLYKTGRYSQQQLASKFGVSQVCISLITRGAKWKEVA